MMLFSHILASDNQTAQTNATRSYIIIDDDTPVSSDAAAPSPERASSSPARLNTYNTIFILEQEALTRHRSHIKKALQQLTEDPFARRCISDVTTLSADALYLKFRQMAHILPLWMKRKGPCFTFKTAERALQLLEGVEGIEHHGASSTFSYQTYHYNDMPTIIEFYVILWNALTANLDNWVKTWLAENAIYFGETFETIGAWIQKHHALVNDLQQFLLNHDIEAVPPFIQNRTCEDIKINLHIWSEMRQCFLDTKDFTPIVEALFIIMRGHNEEIENPDEPNAPACAEGAYLNIIREVVRTLGGVELYAQLAHVTIHNCGDDEEDYAWTGMD